MLPVEIVCGISKFFKFGLLKISATEKKRTENLARQSRNQTVLGAPASRRQSLAETTYFAFLWI
jgi:hypothetical protein